MSRRLLVALFLAIAAREAAASYSVFVAPARYLYVSGDIAAVCGDSTLACTDITRAALRTQCEPRGEGWAASASITMAPVVHLPARAGSGATHKLVAHEFEHVGDFGRAAEGYARLLSRRRFESLEACRAVALQEEAEFGARMLAVARQSVALRR